MNQYSSQIHTAARLLRSEGKTYREIRNQLNLKIPKGTLSGWLKNITPPPDYFNKIKFNYNENIWKAQQVNRIKLQARLKQLREKNHFLVDIVDLKVSKIILATLYWCEGNKYPSSRNLKFGNSDPGMIKLFMTLLRCCYHLDESKFRLTIQCRSDQNLAKLTTYWQGVTKITKSLHYSPRIDRRSHGLPTKKLTYHGVCVIDYFDTNLQCELQFLGEHLGSDLAIEQMKNQIK